MLKSKLVVIRGIEMNIRLTRHAQERSDLRYVETDLLYDTIEAAYEKILIDSSAGNVEEKYPNFVIYHKDFRISCACELVHRGLNVITVCMGVLEPEYPEQKIFEVDVRDRVVIKRGADYR